MVVRFDLQRGVADAVAVGEQRAGLVEDAVRSVPAATIRWAVATSISDVSVHTCRSCTSTTPAIAARSCVDRLDIDARGRRLHEHAQRLAPSRHARGRMNTPDGGADHRVDPVPAGDAPSRSRPTITPTEPSVSDSTSR